MEILHQNIIPNDYSNLSWCLLFIKILKKLEILPTKCHKQTDEKIAK